jgi:hypothetical protein
MDMTHFPEVALDGFDAYHDRPDIVIVTMTRQ